MHNSTKYMLIGSIATGLMLPTAVSADTIKQALDTKQEKSGDHILKQTNKNTTDTIAQAKKEIKNNNTQPTKNTIPHEQTHIVKTTVKTPAKLTKTMIEKPNDLKSPQSNINKSSTANLGTKTGTQEDPPDDQVVKFGDPVLEMLFKKALDLQKRPGPLTIGDFKHANTFQLGFYDGDYPDGYLLKSLEGIQAIAYLPKNQIWSMTLQVTNNTSLEPLRNIHLNIGHDFVISKDKIYQSDIDVLESMSLKTDNNVSTFGLQGITSQNNSGITSKDLSTRLDKLFTNLIDNCGFRGILLTRQAISDFSYFKKFTHYYRFSVIAYQQTSVHRKNPLLVDSDTKTLTFDSDSFGLNGEPLTVLSYTFNTSNKVPDRDYGPLDSKDGKYIIHDYADGVIPGWVVIYQPFMDHTGGFQPIQYDNGVYLGYSSMDYYKIADKKEIGHINVHYVDENGKTIDAKYDYTDKGLVGSEYKTEQKDIPGYTFEKVIGTQTGKFDSASQDVTYVYTKNPVKAGNINIRYVDESGNEISKSEIKSGNIGDKYDISDKIIPGYKLSNVKGNTNGIFTDKEQTIIFIYQKERVPAKQGLLHVNYVDETGKSIAKSETASGNIGDKFDIPNKDIPNYTLVSVTGNKTGAFSEKDQTITFIYSKNQVPTKTGNIHINYVDENSKVIANAETKSGNVGDKFDIPNKDIPGYTVVKIKGPQTGHFSEQDQTITFIYSKNEISNQKGIINVHYVDEQGNSIAKPYLMSGYIGDQYSTKPIYIPGFTFKFIDGVAQGVYSVHNQTISFVYSSNKTIINDNNQINDHKTNDHKTIPVPEKMESNRITTISTSNPKSSNTALSSHLTKASVNQELPTTGENPRNIITIIGLSLLTFIGSFFVNKRK